MGDETWTRERLEQMIQQRFEESCQLDYKAAGALPASEGKKDDITKDVSSFANANGGTIIYGIKEFEEREQKYRPEKLDPIDGTAFTKEWLDQTIGQINPRIDGVRIIPVRIEPAPKVCYVVEIPKGETAHQARDLRYYRRYNFLAQPMHDHEVRDVMNRRTRPKLELRIHLAQLPTCTLKVILCVKNFGKVVPNRYAVQVILPTWIKGELYKEALLHHPVNGQPHWRFMIPGQEIAFPGFEAYSEFDLPYQIGEGQPTEPAPDRVFCTLYADEMPPVRKEVPVPAALAGWIMRPPPR